jgi:hypothetical protein
MTETPTDDLDAFLKTLHDDVRKIKTMASNAATSGDVQRNGSPANVATSDDLKNLERTITQTMGLAVSDLRQEVHTRQRSRKPVLVVLAVLVVLLGGFALGAAFTRSAFNITTEVGCLYFGGQWGEKQDGGFMCWKEVP